MKELVFISIIFLMQDGRVVPGKYINGYGDLEQTSWEHCIERSKWFYENKEDLMPMFGRDVKDAVTFCYKVKSK